MKLPCFTHTCTPRSEPGVLASRSGKSCWGLFAKRALQSVFLCDAKLQKYALNGLCTDVNSISNQEISGRYQKSVDVECRNAM